MSDIEAEITGKWLLPHIKAVLKSIIVSTVVFWLYLRFAKIEPFGLKNIEAICIVGIIRSGFLFIPKLHIYRNQSLKNKFFFILTFIVGMIALSALTINKFYLGNELFTSLGNNNLLFSIIIAFLSHIIDLPQIIIIAIEEYKQQRERNYNVSDNQEINDLYKQGILYYKRNNFDKAIECFNKIIDISPDHYETNVILAKIAVRYPERFSEIMGPPPDCIKNDDNLMKVFKDKGLR